MTLIAVKFTAFIRLIIRTIETWKVLVTQSSNIVHCNQHTQNLYVQRFKAFQTIFPC